MIPTVRGHSGIEMPILGQGTWKMGERPEHVRENAAALAFTLTDEDLDELDRTYAPPSRDAKLETL